MPLASSWRANLPNTRFVAPDAPMHHRYGHRWFSTEGNPLDPERIQSAREAFDGLMNDMVRREGFTDAHGRVAFVGVSQGAIVALDALPPGGGRSARWSRSPACFPRSRFRPRATVRRCFWSMEKTAPPSLPWARDSRLRSSQQPASRSSWISNRAPDTRFQALALKKRCLF
ncbi:hypothetical protein [Rhizobium sp. Leaf391]|uniref:alpha/beta hydrolase n=1 Tax=Rhizobium sp. Leaf391 TaxID=1736360 RepID=UPI001FCD019D|nr:hypothetical protein [Rhizobium sp. Leaf391]